MATARIRTYKRKDRAREGRKRVRDPAVPCVIAKAEGFIILPLASLSPMSPYMHWKKDSRNTSDTLPLPRFSTTH